MEETGVSGENHRPAASHIILYRVHLTMREGLRGRDRMVVEFSTICTISAYHHQTLSYNVVSSTPRNERVRTHNFSGDRH